MSTSGVMFNAYPDSCGGTLARAVDLLRRDELRDAFGLFYILPSMFRSDLDRGFSVISYDLDPELASADDLAALRESGVELKLDFVLNHLSAQSPQFQDVLQRGDDSPSEEMFIDWNEFWAGCGEPGPEGYIVPREEYLSRLFMRKPELPVLKVVLPDGSDRFYWNTFYQQVDEVPAPDDSDGQTRRRYLGQMDLDARSEKVWGFYEETLDRLASYGARVVRLDAFAYLHKEVGRSNFFNVPGTWEYLARIRKSADALGVELLPEIHAEHRAGVHRELAERGYRIYDFFFPALVIHTIERADTAALTGWIREVRDNGYRTVNMLGCHDGIPVLDVRGLLDEEEIQSLIDLITDRGGRLKDLYGPNGEKIAYYQVNATFFSALGEDEESLLLARALQLFMPGIPQVWYLDLFAGANDHEAADTHGHKEINRTNLSAEEIERRLSWPIVRRQLELLRFRNAHPAFGEGAELTIDDSQPGRLALAWSRDGHEARLEADLSTRRFTIRAGEIGALEEV